MQRSTQIWKAALNGIEWTSHSPDKLLSRKRKNCFLSWHHPALHICLMVWPLENGAGNMMVQYALHNFSRAFILFLWNDIYLQSTVQSFPWDVWSNHCFVLFFFFLLCFVRKCAHLCRSDPRTLCVKFVAAGFHAFVFCPHTQVNQLSVHQNRLWNHTASLCSCKPHS